MSTPSPSTRDLARRLLEATRAASRERAGGGPRPHEAVELCEALRNSFSKFAGPDGFAALLRRSLALARADAPALRGVQLGADCRLEGLDEDAAGDGAEAGLALAAHLLELLVTFIGEPLTLRLVRESWPDINSGSDDGPENQRPA